MLSTSNHPTSRVRVRNRIYPLNIFHTWVLIRIDGLHFPFVVVSLFICHSVPNMRLSSVILLWSILAGTGLAISVKTFLAIDCSGPTLVEWSSDAVSVLFRVQILT